METPIVSTPIVTSPEQASDIIVVDQATVVGEATAITPIEPIAEDVNALQPVVKEHVGKCEPTWTEPEDVEFNGSSAVLLTHFTDRLDVEHKTRPALIQLVEYAKQKDSAVVYLHEKDAPNESYFYDDCNPTAYVSSEVGEFAFKTAELKHVILGLSLIHI